MRALGNLYCMITSSLGISSMNPNGTLLFFSAGREGDECFYVPSHSEPFSDVLIRPSTSRDARSGPMADSFPVQRGVGSKMSDTRTGKVESDWDLRSDLGDDRHRGKTLELGRVHGKAAGITHICGSSIPSPSHRMRDY